MGHAQAWLKPKRNGFWCASCETVAPLDVFDSTNYDRPDCRQVWQWGGIDVNIPIALVSGSVSLTWSIWLLVKAYRRKALSAEAKSITPS